MNELFPLRAELLSLTAYRNILRLPVLSHVTEALKAAELGDGEAALAAYGDAFYLLHEQGYTALSDYISNHLHYDSAPYPEMAAMGGHDPSLAAAAKRDIGILRRLSAMDGTAWRGLLARALSEDWQPTLDALPCWEAKADGFSFDDLTAFYQTNGAGLFSKYRAFLWQEGRLHPVEHPDYTAPEDLVGYTLQRNQVYANTAALLAGKPVNNVLLYGESGTGKSATVKSLLGVLEFEALRLIEMDKSELAGIPDLIRMLAHRPQKFILYIDDLAFDKDDQTYSLLKTILEGGLEPKPANVAIYATSNRRHLVRETFSDRMGDEVDAAETIEEKTSLSERFGLRIPFSGLNQEQYLALCYELAEKAGVTLPREQLRTQAIRFNLRHPGRTPRVARQFIQSLHAVS
ncbi:MAG: ATP-binding protein [Oscillospiraceae bacterium]|nr:ATP-binding protein [Oscillospiraceae bacterium]